MKPHYIDIKVEKEADLYNAFDPNGIVLNDELIDYIIDRYSEKDFQERPVLRITCDTQIDRQKQNQALEHHLLTKINKNKRERKLNAIQQWRLFAIGLVFIVLGITLHNMFSSVALEVLSIIGSFAVWEAANKILVENPAKKIERLRFEKLLGTEVVINEKK